MMFYENQPCTGDQKPVYVPVKNVILMNPVALVERVLAARPCILFGHFCKGAKICLRTEAELLSHSQWEPLVVQHKDRYTDCHMAQCGNEGPQLSLLPGSIHGFSAYFLF